MDSININTLFNKKFNNESQQQGLKKNFSITNITSSNIIKNILDDEDIIEKIKNIKLSEKKKLNEEYQEKYNKCLIKINNAIEHDLTDVFYDVNESCFGVKYYNSKECLNFIQNKLRIKKFETFIYSKNSIFISWKNLKNLNF